MSEDPGPSALTRVKVLALMGRISSQGERVATKAAHLRQKVEQPLIPDPSDES